MMIKDLLAEKENDLERVKINRIKKLGFMSQSRNLLAAFRNWAQVSKILSTKFFGSSNLACAIGKLVYKKSFSRIKSFTMSRKKKELRN